MIVSFQTFPINWSSVGLSFDWHHRQMNHTKLCNDLVGFLVPESQHPVCVLQKCSYIDGRPEAYTTAMQRYGGSIHRPFLSDRYFVPFRLKFVGLYWCAPKSYPPCFIQTFKKMVSVACLKFQLATRHSCGLSPDGLSFNVILLRCFSGVDFFTSSGMWKYRWGLWRRRLVVCLEVVSSHSPSETNELEEKSTSIFSATSHFCFLKSSCPPIYASYVM
jgi:hypothetical protein